MLGVDFTQPFQRKGGAGAVARQTFQTIALVASMRTFASTGKPPPCSHSASTCACCADSSPRRKAERSSRRRKADWTSAIAGTSSVLAG